MKDLALNPTTHDLDIVNRDLRLTSGTEEIEQKLSIKLQFFYGEWFLNSQVGIKFYENIFVKNPNLSLVESILKATILETEGVSKLTKFSMDLNNRKLLVSFSVNTIYGPVTINKEIP